MRYPAWKEQSLTLFDYPFILFLRLFVLLLNSLVIFPGDMKEEA